MSSTLNPGKRWLNRKPIDVLDLGDVSNVFERNINCKLPTVVNKGGARSSKSYSLCQLFLKWLFTDAGRRMLITRKTLPALRMTTYGVFIDMLKKYHLYDVKAHNMTERTYRYRSNIIVFTSIDDSQKMKSSEWNKVLFEEADEFDYEDFMSVHLRMSAPCPDDEPNQIFLALNPSNESDFINQKLIGKPDVAVISSTYLDNPFLSPSYVAELEKLREDSPEWWTIYGMGEYAKSVKRIYDGWEEIDEFPIAEGDDFYGLDFGFNNPTCLVHCRVIDGVIYAEESLYKSKLTTGDLIQEIGNRVRSKRAFIYADPEDKRAIEEIYTAGFNIHPAVKEVHNGIDFVKRFKIRMTKRSANMAKEYKSYMWKSDKAGNIVDEPIKFNDHAMDALRYALYSHFMQFGWRAFGTTAKRPTGVTKRSLDRQSRRERDEYAGY